ncbi:hypothetical protein B0O99DRAFT_652199 [Bisporella sp. PMI_857]|nr:hypothetical protein B0O99DRAFT_652199 [Bisporella sp. PMI_857]
MKWAIETKDSTSFSATSLKVPHILRFAEAISVYFPIEANEDYRSLFTDSPFKIQFYMAQAQLLDIGFDYISSNGPARYHSTMRASGTPGRKIDNLLSPTFREEQLLEKYEQGTEKEQAKDLVKIKTRVRVAKFILKGVNFSCSPLQITVLVIACISKSHKKAKKVAVYYTLFAVGFFIFSIVTWNYKKDLFQEEVDYALVCRMQNWFLVCCLIELVLECITVILYGIVLYRYYFKQRLRKSIDVRNRARSDFYLAQLCSQSAPNTLGFGPMFPFYFTHFVKAKSNSALNTKSSALQFPSIKIQSATPKVAQNSFERASFPLVERRIKQVSAAPGEQTYHAVPIPGAYASPLSSPGLAQPQHQ